VPPCPAFSVEVRSLELFLFFNPGWPRTLIFLMSASQVATITDYRHKALNSGLVIILLRPGVFWDHFNGFYYDISCMIHDIFYCDVVK
jgi:hypothetical protein